MEFRDFLNSKFNEWNFNQNSDCKAAQVILKYTKLEPITWELANENPIFSLCVGASTCDHQEILSCKMHPSQAPLAQGVHSRSTMMEKTGSEISEISKNFQKPCWMLIGYSENWFNWGYKKSISEQKKRFWVIPIFKDRTQKNHLSSRIWVLVFEL